MRFTRAELPEREESRSRPYRRVVKPRAIAFTVSSGERSSSSSGLVGKRGNGNVLLARFGLVCKESTIVVSARVV